MSDERHNEIDVTLGPQWQRLEVDGHYMGMVDVESGVFCLYHRGETKWYSLAEMRTKGAKNNRNGGENVTHR